MQIFIIAAMSADGFIGQDAGQSSLEWRSRADAKFFIEQTKQAGVMVMGSTTYKTFRVRKAPPGRRLIVYTTKPETVFGENVETTDEKPADFIERLNREGASALAVCGGAQINTLFLKNDLVDEIFLTVEPVLFGTGVPLLSEPLGQKLTLLESRQLAENTILLHYAVDK